MNLFQGNLPPTILHASMSIAAFIRKPIADRTAITPNITCLSCFSASNGNCTTNARPKVTARNVSASFNAVADSKSSTSTNRLGLESRSMNCRA